MEADMKSRYMIAVGAVVLAVVGMTIAQPPKVEVPPAPTDPGMLPPPGAVPKRGTVEEPRVRSAEAKPEDMTIEQLLDAVEKFREQKSEIEKKEKAFMKVVHQKAGKLKQRIEGLDGVVPPPMAPSIVPGGAPPAFPTPPGPTPLP
jgi:hypothetical protein